MPPVSPCACNKLVKVNEAMYGDHVIDVFEDVSIRNIAISLTRRILDGARRRLVRRFFDGHGDDGQGDDRPPSWIAKHAPRLARVFGPAGKEIGATADVLDVVKLAAVRVSGGGGGARVFLFVLVFLVGVWWIPIRIAHANSLETEGLPGLSAGLSFSVLCFAE